MVFDYAPASNLTTIDAGRPIASPVSGASPITVEVPRTAPASNSSPPFWRTATRNGPGGIDAQVFTQNGAADIGSTYYEPVTGDLSARPRPSTSPRLNPVNGANTATTQARAATPSAPVNPRIPRITPSTLARGGLSVGVGLAVELAAQAAFNAAFPGAAERSRAYDARNADPRSAIPTSGEISAGIGALGAGAIGAAAVGAAIATRYGLPDEVDEGNPRGLLGRILGWDEDYPNALDPDAMEGGPVIDPGEPAPFTGGQSPGVAYIVYSSGQGPTGSSCSNSVVRTGGSSPVWGPIEGFVLDAPVFCSGPFGTAKQGYVVHNGGQKTAFGPAYYSGSITHVVRYDGKPDTGGDPPPVRPPVVGPNPARPPRTPDGEPPALPEPPLPEPPPPAPWPGVAPQRPPDTAPLAPPPPRPAPFAPSPSPAPPNTPTNPAAPPGPPDLDPAAPPRAEPPDLGTDPDTPPAPAPGPAPVNEEEDVNEAGEPFNGWTIGGVKQYGSGPMQWGSARLTSDSGWQTADGSPITEEEIAERLRPYGGQEAIDRALGSPTGTTIKEGGQGQIEIDQPGGTLTTLPPAPLPVPPVLPVPVPVGGVAPATTPSPPSLVPRTPVNPNVREVVPPVRQTPTEGPKGTCFYEFQRVADIQAKATSTNQQATNPTSGFTGLYGIGIESRLKIGESFTLLQSVNNFMRKAWEMTRMQKILDVLTFIGVMHNVGMLSRDVGETFMQLVSQGLQAVGIRDEEGSPIQVEEVVGNTVENVLKGILGESVYNGIGDAWNKANRIISSASAIIWTVRSIADSSLDLMEWIGENTGRIGNALKRWGVVGERSYPWMSESARAQTRYRNRFSRLTNALENAEDRISVFTQATSNVIEIQEETQELGENWTRFRESVEQGIPDPWADNAPVQEAYDASKAVSEGPDVPPADAQKGA